MDTWEQDDLYSLSLSSMDLKKYDLNLNKYNFNPP